MTSVRSVALLALVALLGGACSANPAGGAATASDNPAWVILDADSHGAVLLGAASGAPDVLRGVDRDGNRSWERNDLAAAMPAVVCLGSCPAAVVSSGTVTGVDLPTTVLGTTRALDTKAAILSAPGEAVVEETHVAPDAVTLALTAGSAREQLAISGTQTTWRPSNDNRSAMALVGDAAGSSYSVRTFHRDIAWKPTQWTAKSSTLFGCAGEGGRRVVVTDPQPVLVDLRDGTRAPIQGLESGGDCAFAGETAVVAQYGLRGSAYHSVLVTVGRAGDVLWRQEYGGEVRIRADLGGQAFLTLTAGKMEERDARGAILQSADGVADARYDENGDIVLVTDSGAVRRLAGRSRAIAK